MWRFTEDTCAQSHFWHFGGVDMLDFCVCWKAISVGVVALCTYASASHRAGWRNASGPGSR